jgi:hypothetical protein
VDQFGLAQAGFREVNSVQVSPTEVSLAKTPFSCFVSREKFWCLHPWAPPFPNAALAGDAGNIDNEDKYQYLDFSG